MKLRELLNFVEQQRAKHPDIDDWYLMVDAEEPGEVQAIAGCVTDEAREVWLVG